MHLVISGPLLRDVLKLKDVTVVARLLATVSPNQSDGNWSSWLLAFTLIAC
jgi:hypothetical protein